MKLPKIPWNKVANFLLQVGLQVASDWAMKKHEGGQVLKEEKK